MAPSCCIILMLSIWPQCSTNLPFLIRTMSITPKDTLLPVAGTPINSPFWVPLRVSDGGLTQCDTRAQADHLRAGSRG